MGSAIVYELLICCNSKPVNLVEKRNIHKISEENSTDSNQDMVSSAKQNHKIRESIEKFVIYEPIVYVNVHAIGLM